MQKRINIRLLISLTIVILAIVGLQVSKPGAGNLGVDKKMFQLNPEEEITDVFLQGPETSNHLQFKNGQWYVNDTLLLDQSMRDVFFSVLTQLEIRRPVAKNIEDSIARHLLTDGISTTVSFGDEKIIEYSIGGDPAKEISWIMDNEEKVPFEVHLPGYQTYTAGIFKVPANDWRSRFVIDVNFALIKSIKLVYPDEANNLEFVSTKDFFKVPDMEVDSIKIADFLDNLAYLQADKFLTKEDISEEYSNHLQNNNLYATIDIEMSYGENTRLYFYKQLPASPYTVARISDGSVGLFEFKRIEGVFVRRGEL